METIYSEDPPIIVYEDDEVADDVERYFVYMEGELVAIAYDLTEVDYLVEELLEIYYGDAMSEDA